jgi:phosphoglucosamine mutase
MKRLFGTDGIRGAAGEFPLDAKTMRIVGAALADIFREKLGRDPRFLTGRDTRESGSWIEEAIHAGAHASNAVCISSGVITTPGVAFVTSEFGFDAGVGISASHNPYQDNGIKIFLPSGQKSDEEIELAIEAVIYKAQDVKAEGSIVDTSRIEEFHAAYLGHLKDAVNGLSLSGLKIVIDCANGASCGFALPLFRDLGADVVGIHNVPNGTNINENCGSLHLEDLQARVLEEKADVGIAFDGDADRSLFVNERGEKVDGDATLWILAQYLKSRGKLADSRVVATVMSNIGLELALRTQNIELCRVNVGDKYVLEELISGGSELGGEQSGHIILPEIGLVGDGMMTALLLLRAITGRGVSLSAAADGFVAYPQILKNVRVKDKKPFTDVPAIAKASKELDSQLAGEGRLLLRYSGTENLARVMIEGKDQQTIERQASELASVIERALG